MNGKNLSDETRWFLTVEWCHSGERGVFCSASGGGFQKREPHTLEEMDVILGPFSLVLGPKSIEMTPEELEEYTYYRPLAEYSMQYGIALKQENVPIRVIEALAQEPNLDTKPQL